MENNSFSDQQSRNQKLSPSALVAKELINHAYSQSIEAHTFISEHETKLLADYVRGLENILFSRLGIEGEGTKPASPNQTQKVLGRISLHGERNLPLSLSLRETRQIASYIIRLENIALSEDA